MDKKSKHHLYRAGFLSALITVLSLTACGRNQAPSITLMESSTMQADSDENKPAELPYTVKIGFIGPISGPYAAEGAAARNAFQLAIDEANNSGRFPYRIETIIVDDKSSEEAAVSGVRRILADPLVLAVSGFWNSGPAAAAIPLFIEAKIPLLIWGAIRETLTSENNVPWITRSAPTDKQENIPLARAVLDDMGYKDWFIVSDTSSYGSGNFDAFLKELSVRSITPAGTEHVQEDSRDFGELVQKIKSSGAKAVYCGSTYSIGSELKRQLYEAGVKDILFCGISGMKTDNFFRIGSSAAEGALVVSPGIILDETALGRRFIELYNSKAYSQPIGAYTPYAYEAALILLNSLSVCGSKPAPAEMAGAIFRSSTAGIMGTTAFNEIGQTVNVAAYLNVAQNGSWIPYQNSMYSKGARSFGGR